MVSWLVARTRVSDMHENDRTCTNKGIFVTELVLCLNYSLQNRVGSKFHFLWNDKESGVQFLNCDLKSKTLLNSVTFFFLEKIKNNRRRPMSLAMIVTMTMMIAIKVAMTLMIALVVTMTSMIASNVTMTLM